MELQIQDLVDSIKRDGIAEAEKQAAQIIAEAKSKADEMVRAASRDAAKLIDDARKEVAVMRQSGRADVEQAGRDVMLSLKKSIAAQFERLLEQEVAKTLSGKELVSLIARVVESGLSDPASSVVEMKDSDWKAFAASLQDALAKDIKNGLEIRPVPAVDVGFRYAAKDGSSYFDFSAAEIAKLLAPFLNASTREILFPSPESR